MTIFPLPTRTPCRRRFQADSALRAALGIVALLAAVASGARVAPAQESREAPTEWPAIVAEARGQSVFWNAWDGDERINAYIGWVGERVAADFGITLRHVKLADTLPRFALRPAALDRSRYRRFAEFLQEQGVIDKTPPLETYAVTLE